MADSIQALCAAGQDSLENTDYLAAEQTLARAEAIAWESKDWDALARLYMPLQEARRQRRQRALDGQFFFQIADEPALATTLASEVDQGIVLLAGEASLAPSLALRQRVAELGRYVDVFLTAAYRIGEDYAVLVVPNQSIMVPSASMNSVDTLIRRAPPHSVLLRPAQVPGTRRVSDSTTGAFVMDLWEQLHRPFLAMAEACTDPVMRISAYRDAIAVDYACEIAHQHLSDTAHQLARAKRLAAH